VAQEILFPDEPFFIVSSLDHTGLALSLDKAGKLVLAPLLGSPGQRWVAERDRRGGALLRHVASGLALTCKVRRVGSSGSDVAIDGPEALVFAAPPGQPDLAQRWRAETLGFWTCLNSQMDWEYKLNVLGGDKTGRIGVRRWENGAPQECWLLPTEAGVIALQHVRYDLDRAVAEHLPPTPADPALIVDNRAGGEPLEKRIVLTRTCVSERGCRLEPADRARLAGATIHEDEVSIGVVVTDQGDCVEREMAPTPLDDPEPHRTVSEERVEVAVHVPPGRVYSYQALVRHARVRAPFTARLLFHGQGVGVESRAFEVAGVFSGVNPVETRIQVRDLTPKDGDMRTAGRGEEPPVIAELTPA